jgi:hypothetical protein
MGVPGSALGSARVSRALSSLFLVGAAAIRISDTGSTRRNRSRAYLPGLLLYSPESVDYFGTALLEFAMMNCGQTRGEQCAG